ncbi:MAG: hypothetical protein Q8P67_06545, partial [archaeon]|nr:hypothetical protein [archaeon]
DLISSLAFGGRFIYSASHDASIKVWSFEGSEGKSLLHHSDKVLDLLVARDCFFSASADHSIATWSLHSQELLDVDTTSHSDSVSAMALVISPDDCKRSELWSASNDALIHIKPLDPI